MNPGEIDFFLINYIHLADNNKERTIYVTTMVYRDYARLQAAEVPCCSYVFFVTFRITLRVRKLLRLIPTDPEVQDALDNFVPKESSFWSHQVHHTVC